jgi:formylglycine-generating enzyme required for sulfatase activity
MPRIFLSYRRQDSQAATGRICDRLLAHFGAGSVFMDIDSIPFGADFREHIDKAVGQADLVLAVIGPRWSGKTETSRRIDDPRDFVRIELESALKRQIPIIPVLLDHTRMPTEAEVPPSLGQLTFRNAIEVDQGRDFHPHVDRLVRGIEFHFEQLKARTAQPPKQPQSAAAKAPIPNAPRASGTIASAESGQQFKAKPQGAGAATPKPPVIPAKPVAAQPLPQPASDTRQPIQLAVVELVRLWRKALGIPRLSLYAAAVPVLALLGLIIYIVNDNGTVKINGTDPSIVVRIDQKVIPFERRGDPITLRVGRHRLEVERGEFNCIGELQIKRGKETPLDADAFVGPPDAKRGDAEAGSPNRSELASSKPASPPTDVESPKTAPPTRTAPPGSPQPGREWTNSIGMKLVRIDPGEFTMGTTKAQVDQLMTMFPEAKRELFDDEQPEHSVRISRPYYLGTCEVTQGQYQAVMGQFPSKYTGSDDLPAEQVSWLDAIEFCNKLSLLENRPLYYRIDGQNVTITGGNGYRLPNEAEWEYACRAGSSTLYPFGDNASELDRYAWYERSLGSEKHAVGKKLPNAWGLYDMLGNVWEWCGDRYDEKYYASSPPVDPPGVSGAALRVIRGGSWGHSPRFCRSASRYGDAPGYRLNNLGFRVAAAQ